MKQSHFHSNFPPELVAELNEHGIRKVVEKGVVILKEGERINYIPVVLNGLVKVFSHHNDREFLLYYIDNDESCVMSFVANLQNDKSNIYAVTEETSELLLLPSYKVKEWAKKYMAFNHLYFGQFNQRYNDLIDTINTLLFDKMDKRVLDFLSQRSKLTGKNPIKLSHQQIAAELSTAREVVSRVLKKLELEGALEQDKSGIKLLNP